MTKEEVRRLDHAWKRGIALGLEQASNYVLECAVEYFKCNCEATERPEEMLRDMAEELKKKSREARPKGVGV